MKLLIFILTLHLCNSVPKPQYWDTIDKYRLLIDSQGVLHYKPCEYAKDNAINDFRKVLYNFTTEGFKKLAAISGSHFVFSPISLWRTLAAVAEGSEDQARAELFMMLQLPDDECLRKQFYQLAKTLEPPGEDVKLDRKSLLILDESAALQSSWKNFAQTNKLLKTWTAPLKSDPDTATELIRKTLSLQMPYPNFEGNSIIVDTLDYEGLWSSAFADAVVQKAPFYDDLGKRIGSVDLMKIKTRVKMTYVALINAKVLDLPVGIGGRYHMLFALSLGKTQVRSVVPRITGSVIYDILETLTESIIPLDVAIPRFRMTSEIDMRKVMEDFGVKSLWVDEEATRNISEPAAFPSDFIQRATIVFDTTGVKAPLQDVSNRIPKIKSTYLTETGLDPLVGRNFIVDKPFYFGLFDSKTYTCLYCAIFSIPTYKI